MKTDTDKPMLTAARRLRLALAPGWAGTHDTEDEEDAARIGAQVRELIAASKLIHQTARERCGLTPARQLVEVLCEALLTELAALAAGDAALHGAAPTDDARERRIGHLLLAGRTLVDDHDAGLFDGGPAGLALLAAQARRLGERYADLLPRIAVPGAVAGAPIAADDEHGQAGPVGRGSLGEMPESAQGNPPARVSPRSRDNQ